MLRGSTLPELMLILAVLALLLGIAVPRLSRAMDLLEVEAATSAVIGAHQRARTMSIVRGQVLNLNIEPAQLTIVGRNAAVPLWTHPGPAAAGVRLAGPVHQIAFSPTGITLGLSNTSVVLSRGASLRTIVFSRLGRVRVLR
jgi:Tfp pilus assembly protein FimT